MPAAVLAREVVDAVWARSGYESAYGVRVNALSVEQLFALYERAGFLYPAKAARLSPHLDTVRENWRRLLRAGDSLLYVLTAGDEREGFASVAVWRTTHSSWVWQHLVCESHPLHSRAVMLGGLARCIRRGIEQSQQNWFRPENRFPARVFGSMVSSVGESFSSVQRHMYFAVPRRARTQGSSSVRVVAYDERHREALCRVATASRGALYVRAEDLDGDVGLQSIDALYRAVGLRRTRHVWLAYRPGCAQPAGAAIAYRGPLGLNFSFLENRCDLLLDPAMADAEATAVSAALLDAAVAAYSDFELQDWPVVADCRSAAAIGSLGGQFVRNYCQGIWLRDGQPQLYRHVDHFYTRLIDRVGRRRAQASATA